MNRFRPDVFALFLAFTLTAACGEDQDATSAPDRSPDAGADAQVDPPDADSDAGQDPASTLPERPWAVDAPGYYKVGFTEREVTYQARGQDEPRTLRLAIWYPTFVDDEGPYAEYFGLFRRQAVRADVPVAVDEPMPLLVFSHGNAALAEQSYFMSENFASHGWIVASPDHTGNTFQDTGGAINLEAAVFRPQDLSAVIDDMLALPAPHQLSGLIDGDSIAVSGHSFGAVTTLAIAGANFALDDVIAGCELDEVDPDICAMFDNPDYVEVFRDGFYDDRVDVAIPQAPGGYVAFQDGLADIEIPTLLFTGGMDRTLPPRQEGDPIWAAMTGPQHLRVDLPMAGHFTFSNMCDWFRTIDQVANDGCNDEFIEPALAYDIINAYSLAWSRHHIFGDPTVEALVSGDEVPWSDVVLSQKPGE